MAGDRTTAAAPRPTSARLATSTGDASSLPLHYSTGAAAPPEAPIPETLPEERALRIVVADAHPLLRIGVRRALERDGGFEIVGEASSGSQVPPLVERLRPDAVVLDLHMPGMAGFAILDRLAAMRPRTKVVVLDKDADPDRVEAAFRHGVCAYLVKTVQSADLGAAVRDAVRGTVVHHVGASALGDGSILEAHGLSEREAEILRALARGLPNKLIAQELWITVSTVKFHLSNIYRALGITNRAEATRWAVENGIHVEPPAHRRRSGC